MARSRCNPQVDDGRSSPPPAQEEKEEAVEESDGSNGVVQENGRGVKGGQQRERDSNELGQHIAMLGKMWVPHLQTGFATMWN